MIAHVKGRLDSATPTEAVVDVGGVGYQVFIPMSTFDKLPLPGGELKLLTYMNVREDAIQLFGFASAPELELFKLLITVNGVGAKTALNVLSSVSVESFCSAIAAADIKLLKKLNGIGPKTAERLALELRDKISDISPQAATAKAGLGPSAKALDDALMALESLGFQKAKIQKSVTEIAASMPEKERSSENIIRKALQALNK